MPWWQCCGEPLKRTIRLGSPKGQGREEKNIEIKYCLPFPSVHYQEKEKKVLLSKHMHLIPFPVKLRWYLKPHDFKLYFIFHNFLYF